MSRSGNAASAGGGKSSRERYSSNRGGARAFRPANKNLEAVEGVLRSALRSAGIDKELDRYRFVLHWEEIVGSQIARRSKPEALRGSTIIVRVANSVWAQELSFQREVILARLNRFLGEDRAITDVLFYVGELDARR